LSTEEISKGNPCFPSWNLLNIQFTVFFGHVPKLSWAVCGWRLQKDRRD
jgi:hypothetical protein